MLGATSPFPSPTPIPLPQLPPPCTFGLPAKFTGYRRYQSDAIVRGFLSPTRFTAQAAPVGFGKSLNAVLQAVLRGERTVILTATKGLQDQYHREFAAIGLVDQRGRDNYPYCGNIPGTNQYTCETGPCLGGIACRFKNKGCLYDAAVAAFNSSQLAVTNYAWWLAVAGNPNIAPPQFLVLDEAHDAPAQLENALAFELWDNDARKYLTPHPQEQEPGDMYVNGAWAGWARAESSRLSAMVDGMAKTRLTQESFPLYKTLKRLAGNLQRLSTAGPSVAWVWDRMDRSRGWKFAPLDPAQFAEPELFRGVPRVLLTSGTITPKTLVQLGLTPTNTNFQDYPSPFDPSRAPVTLLDTKIRNTKNITDEEFMSLIATMDNIIGSRLDRKGIIHTVSYGRQELILANSQWAGIMYANRRKTRGVAMDAYSAAEVVAAFKAAPAPAVLVSPSVTTGWDFPGPQCEYQLIPKLPFPDMSGRILQARVKSDPGVTNHICAVELQQMCGRGMRMESDRCETFILDASGRWFFGNGNKHYFNQSFWQFFRWGREGEVPPPAPKL